MVLRKSAGVSLLEVLMVVILMMVTVALFSSKRKSQMELVYREEARMLIEDIVSSEHVYYSRYSKYITNSSFVKYNAKLGIDARKNSFYNQFQVTTSATDSKGWSDTIIDTNNPEVMVVVTGGQGSVTAHFTRDNPTIQYSW